MTSPAVFSGGVIDSDEPFEIDGEIVECWNPERNKKVRVHGWDCLEAAIYAVETHEKLSQILWQCVEYGGDVDTVAAIAIGPASCSREIEQDLPLDLTENFEPKGRFGTTYLQSLDQALFAKFPRSSSDADASVPQEVCEEPLPSGEGGTGLEENL